VRARLYDWLAGSLERKGLGAWRGELLAQATGDVLEVGAGTGWNLPHYPDDVAPRLIEPDSAFRAALQARGLAAERAFAEDLPCDDASYDTIVCTLVLCSVRDPAQAVREFARVLRPGGRLLLIEHVAARDPGLRRWQGWVEPGWRCLSGNCHLTRDPTADLNRAGFDTADLRQDALPGARGLFRPALVGAVVRP